MSYRILAKKLLNNSKSFKRWSLLKKTTYKHLKLHIIIDMLRTISGNDLRSLLDDITSFENNKLNEKYYDALNEIGLMYHNNKIEKNFSPYVKRKLIKCLRSSRVKRFEAKLLGFNCSKYLWRKCLSSNKPKKRGRHPIPQDLALAIQDHLEVKSVINVNQTVKSKFFIDGEKKSSIDIPVYHRTETLKECYNSFPFKDSLGYATFFKYKGNQFKKLTNFKDLCRICEYGKILKNKVFKKATEMEFVSQTGSKDFNIEEFKNFLIELPG